LPRNAPGYSKHQIAAVRAGLQNRPAVSVILRVRSGAPAKAGCFIVEGLNSFATTLYFYYVYFFMQKRFGFGDKSNLVLAALAGIVYAVAVLWGGRFAQRAGYFTALKIGSVVMLMSWAVGSQLDTAVGQIIVLVMASIGMGFTWPPLEALVSEGETPVRLQQIIGLYNVIWAGTGALAYFIGGAMLEKLGLNSIFLVPVAILVIQIALTLSLERATPINRHSQPTSDAVFARSPATLFSSEGQRDGLRAAPVELNPRPIARAKSFLRMAWLANPFGYIAINTLVAVTPGVAARLGLSTALAGFCCSVWCFARLGAFFALWFWPGWHYRFRWLIGSYLALVFSFAVILMVPSLLVLITSQLVLGAALGMIYYSSLFYSMDVGETKAEHGGIHEATIGLGNCAGPAVGAAALHFLPQYTNSGAVAVGVLLLCGLGGLLRIWSKSKT
jgi:predicted MFS family arabinose efflux permease